MSAISLKSITGITSITTPAGVDDQLTLHNNNTTERVKIDVAGNVHINNQLAVAGITTFSSNAFFGNNVRASFASNNRLQIVSNGINSYLDYAGSLNVRGSSGSASALSFLSNSNVLIANNLEIVKDLDVDGHTNLDNVSIAGVTTFASGNVQLASDSQRLQLGSGQDLWMYHTGTSGGGHALIQNDYGTMYMLSDNFTFRDRSTNHDVFRIDQNNSVSLFYQNSSKLSTTNTGVSVSGTLVADALDISGDIDVDGHTNLDNVNIAGVTTFTGQARFNGEVVAGDVISVQTGGSINIPDKLIHSGDPDTAIRFPAADTIRFEVGNQQAVHILPASAGSGGARMGLGTNNPTGMLHIYGSNPPFRIQNSNDSANLQIGMWDTANIMLQASHRPFKIATETSHPIVFHTGGLNNERLRIDSSGRVLIGTTNNTSVGSIDQNVIIGSTTNNEEVALTLNVIEGTNNRRVKFFLDDNDGVFGVDGTASTGVPAFVVRSATSEKLRINQNGKVIIGNNGTTFGNAAVQAFIQHGNTAGESGFSSVDTTSVAEGVGGEIAFHGKYNTGAQDYAYFGHIRGTKENATAGDTACALKFFTRPNATAPQERLTINSGGDVTVNTGTLYIPQWISHVGDTDSKFGFLQPDIIEFQVAGTQRLKIMNTGQIRIDQATSANNGIRMRPSGWNYDFRMGAVSSSGGSIWLGQNYEPTGGTRDSATYGTNYIRFTTQGEILLGTGATNTNPTKRLKIKSDGTVNVGNADSVAPWGATGNVNSGVRLVNNGLTGYAISANSNDIAGIFNRTNTQGTILECKYNGVVKHALGDNFTAFYAQQNTFRYDNAGGIGAYLSIMNRGASSAGTACGIAFGCDTSDAQLDGSDTGNGQIKVRNDGSDGGIMSFHVHTGGNFEAMKIVGNLNSTRNATNGNSVALKGGVAFSTAGIAIDKSWDNYPGLHVFNATGHSDTNQGQFRFHGWNTSYNSYPQSSGADFSVNLVCDGTGLTSDERRKTGISTITNALNTVSQLRGVKYTQVNRELKPQTHMTMDNGQKLGFIAQEVIPHLPSIVIDSGDHVQPMENGYCDRYMIDYGSVVALLTEAVKELKSKNEALEARIATLESS